MSTIFEINVFSANQVQHHILSFPLLFSPLLSCPFACYHTVSGQGAGAAGYCQAAGSERAAAPRQRARPLQPGEGPGSQGGRSPGGRHAGPTAETEEAGDGRRGSDTRSAPGPEAEAVWLQEPGRAEVGASQNQDLKYSRALF